MGSGQCRFTSWATLRTRVGSLEQCGSDRCGEIGWSGNVSRTPRDSPVADGRCHAAIKSLDR